MVTAQRMRFTEDDLKNLFAQMEKGMVTARVEVDSTESLEEQVVQMLRESAAALEGTESIRKRTFLGSMWGADWFQVTGFPPGKIRLLTAPKFGQFMEWDIDQQGRVPKVT